MKTVQNELAELRGGQISFLDMNKSILQNNLYGVDINAESVEITKLSLWLRTADKHKSLTNLNNTIKCGNSLVSDSEIAGDLAFDWNKEFSTVMSQGGFDIVIGNPPYGAKLSDSEKRFIREHFETTEGKFDTYRTFLELGIRLTKDSGYLGYITPNTYFVLEKGGKKLRKFLFDNCHLTTIVDFPNNVFKDAQVSTAISIFHKKEPLPNDEINVFNVSKKSELIEKSRANVFKQREIMNSDNYKINFRINLNEQRLIDKIGKISVPLKEFCGVNVGVLIY